jgi:hypothetical protein
MPGEVSMQNNNLLICLSACPLLVASQPFSFCIFFSFFSLLSFFSKMAAAAPAAAVVEEDDEENEEGGIEPPPSFVCPITTGLMGDPVLGLDGHNYEREALDQALARAARSPMTTVTLLPSQHVPSS